MQVRQTIFHQILIGALSGLVAAGPMGLVMLLLYRLLPRREQYALPPEQITVRVADRANVGEQLGDKQGRRAATWLAHLGYGAATGSLYPLLTSRLNMPAVLKGMLFALGVWTSSYLGWLPLSGLMPPATQLPARRNALMILSHLVWGAIIGVIAKEMEEG